MTDAPVGTPEQWQEAGIQWIREYFEANEDAPPLTCSAAEMATHGRFVGDCLKSGTNPTHFVVTLIFAQRKHQSTPHASPLISFRDFDDEGNDFEATEPLMEWIEQNLDRGCLEDRLEKVALIAAELLSHAIQSGKTELELAAVMLDADGDDFELIPGQSA